MDERGAARFNPYHAKAGSSAGGQFSSSSGGSGASSAKAPGGHAPLPPGGSHDAAHTPRQRLLAEAHADEQRARELEKELHALQHQHRAAVAAAKHHAAQAAAAKKAGHAVHHQHHHAAHHRHHKHAATLHQRITHLKTEIHHLREHAAELEKQAHASRASDSGIPGHLPHQLASWWEHGGGAARIRWGEGGDFMRCVRLAVEEAHMTPERAKGFCAERHHAALGIWPATHAAMEKRAGRSAVTAGPEYDSDGLDGSWDGDHSDLPDLSGLHVHHFEAAAGDMPPGEQAQRAMPKLGTGGRFKKLKASLAAKGAHDPGALAAYIGRKKYGKGKFMALASKARGGAKRSEDEPSRGELMRDFPLEDLHIVRSAEGGDGRTMEAFAAVFNTETGIRDHQGEDYLEVIEPAAFNKRISDVKRSRPGFGQVKVLFNHGRDMEGSPAERFQMPVAVPVTIEATPRGLLTRSRFVSTPLGDEVLELVNAGAVTSMSFTGRIIRSDPQLSRGGRYRPKTLVRRLELGLREFGPVLFPAYEGAEINGVRMWVPGSQEPDDEFDFGTSFGEEAAAGEPLGEHSARHHQHELYVLRSREQREEAGLAW